MEQHCVAIHFQCIRMFSKQQGENGVKTVLVQINTQALYSSAGCQLLYFQVSLCYLLAVNISFQVMP